jgi:benzoate/toluate 1,2-dioxygenase reductase subunit
MADEAGPVAIVQPGRPSCGAASATLRFADGVEHVVSVAPGELVLDAALAANIPVLNQCRSGSCTSCTARLVEGEASMRAGVASSLTRNEHEEGLRLLCLTEALGDCRFAIDYDSTAGANGPVRVQAFVDAIDRVASDVVRLRLELAEGHWMDFRPGQFVQFRVPGTDEVRSYSMASAPDALPALEFLVRLLPSGAMSDWLRTGAAVDDIVELEGPFGHFFLREKVRAPHVMIAGGTGLAPMMAMIDALRKKSGRKPPVLLSFGCTHADGLFHLDALDLRRLWLPSLDLRISVEQGEAGEGVLNGNPVAAIGAADATDPETVAYLCGPPGMIHAARTHLEGFGLKPENIFAEQFVASN